MLIEVQVQGVNLGACSRLVGFGRGDFLKLQASVSGVLPVLVVCARLSGSNVPKYQAFRIFTFQMVVVLVGRYLVFGYLDP